MQLISHLGNRSNAFLSLTDSVLFTEQEKAEDGSEEGSKVDSKEVDATQTHGVVGSLKPAEMEVTEDDLKAHIDLSEETGKEESSYQSEANRKQEVEETVEEGELLLPPVEEEQLQQHQSEDLFQHGEQLQQHGQDLEKQSCNAERVSPMQHNGKKSYKRTQCRRSFTHTDDLKTPHDYSHWSKIAQLCTTQQVI